MLHDRDYRAEVSAAAARDQSARAMPKFTGMGTRGEGARSGCLHSRQ